MTLTEAAVADETPLSFDDIRDRTLITVPEAGRVLGIHRSTAYDWARRGELPVVRIGGRVWVSVPQLLARIEGNASPTSPTTTPED